MAVLVQGESPTVGDPNAQAASGPKRRRRHNKGLLLVALFKLAKAIFFGSIGIGALHLLHRDFGDLVMRLLAILQFDPAGRFASLVMNQADLIGNHQLRQVGYFSLAYAALCIVEGTGLYLEKTWAEYFTVILTVLLLPYEIWELVHEPSAIRISLLVLNLLVLVYLLWLIRRMRRRASGPMCP